MEHDNITRLEVVHERRAPAHYGNPTRPAHSDCTMIVIRRNGRRINVCIPNIAAIKGRRGPYNRSRTVKGRHEGERHDCSVRVANEVDTALRASFSVRCGVRHDLTADPNRCGEYCLALQSRARE